MTLPLLPENIKLLTKYENITSGLQIDIEKLARTHLLKYQDSYLKPFLKKPDAIITTTVVFMKNKQEKYTGTFDFVLDGTAYHRENDVPFKEPLDVVNHAFKHLKEFLAHK